MPTTNRTHEIIFNPPDPITFAQYCDGVRMQASHAKSAAGAVRVNAPADLSPAGRLIVDRIEEIAVLVDDIQTERQVSTAVRPAFEDFRGAWGGLSEALLGKSRIPASIGPSGARAAKLHARLFPEGHGFIISDAHSAWSEGDRILRVIAQQGLKPELDELVGPEFHQAVRKASSALREALGIGRTPRETPSTTRLAQAMQLFTRTLGRYARIIAADVDLDDPESVERFRKAVMVPFDQFRTRRTASGEVEGEDTDPQAPAQPTEPGVTPTPTPTPVADGS